MDKTAVIVLHYQSEDDTRDCLKSLILSKSKNESYQIILVDNSKKGQFIKDLKKEYREIFIIENKNNLGFAKGNNVGIKQAMRSGFEQVILLNNDTLVPSGFVERLVDYAGKDDQIGLVSPKIYFAKGHEYHKNRYNKNEMGKVIWYAGGLLDWDNVYAAHRGVDEVDQGQFEKETDTDFATGCCLLIKKKVFDTIGLLDDKYFLYYEDVDFSLRARKANFRVVYFPGIYIWHKNASTLGSGVLKSQVYYQTRNRLYFGMKYARLKVKKSLIWQSFKLLFEGNPARQAVIDYYIGKMGKKNI